MGKGFERISTGIKGFDELIGGGIPKGHKVLISGAPGTGKSIFCMQVLYNCAKKLGNVLYVTFEQKEEDVIKQMERFGWNIHDVSGKFRVVALDSGEPDVIEDLKKAVTIEKYDMVVVDSLASLVANPMDPSKMGPGFSFEQVVNTVVPMPMDAEIMNRIKVKLAIECVKDTNTTPLFISETVEGTPGYSRDTISEFLCDGVVLMHYLGVGSSEFRSMQVMKMRLTDHEKGTILFDIGKNGIELRKREEFVKR
ncbi:MAG: ATPase domain-containing protein [Candidatus Diapherotrites archaeon]